MITIIKAWLYRRRAARVLHEMRLRDRFLMEKVAKFNGGHLIDFRLLTIGDIERLLRAYDHACRKAEAEFNAWKAQKHFQPDCYGLEIIELKRAQIYKKWRLK